jgi:TM2 domain-containing membrane protein YozV
VLFGLLGVHRFYLGLWGSGLVYMCTGGLCGVGWLVDLCLLRSLVQVSLIRHCSDR